MATHLRHPQPAQAPAPPTGHRLTRQRSPGPTPPPNPTNLRRKQTPPQKFLRRPLTCGFSWSQGDLNPRPLACHLSAQSSALFIAVQNRPLTWTDAGVLVHGCSYPFGSVAAPVAAIAVAMLLVLFRFCQIPGAHKLK